MSDTFQPPHHYHVSLPSTNAALKEAARVQPLPYRVVQAGYQTAGRGQAGNLWESEPEKNLLFSILVVPQKLHARAQFLISKAVSVALIQTLKPHVPGVQIKWPNDIYVGEGKLAGILIENMLQQEHIRYSVVGIGLNVNQELFHSDAPNPVSLFQLTGTVLDIQSILNDFIAHLKACMQWVDDGQWALLHAQYAHYLYRKEGTHRFRDTDGEFMAQIHGIAPEGFLLLKDQNQTIRSYAFKEVAFL